MAMYTLFKNLTRSLKIYMLFEILHALSGNYRVPPPPHSTALRRSPPPPGIPTRQEVVSVLLEVMVGEGADHTFSVSHQISLTH